MTFPLIREILCALAEVDFLAALSLTETSGTLYHFIFGQVVTAPLLCDFLQQNQYALHHDIYGSQFSNREIALLHRAVEFFRHRENENDFYDKIIPFLGPLIARTPLRAFETSPRIPDTAPAPEMRYADGSFSRGIRMQDIRNVYARILETSWLHVQGRDISEQGSAHAKIYQGYASASKSFLREEFLFLKQYLENVTTFLQAIGKVFPGRFHSSDTLDEKLAEFQQLVLERHTGLNLVFLNCCHTVLIQQPSFVFSVVFQTMFEHPGYPQSWSTSQLGVLFAHGLSRWGLEGSAESSFMGDLINRHFRDLKEALVWLFLGAHDWYHGKTIAPPSEPVTSRNACCLNASTSREKLYLERTLISLPREDRQWILEQILRRAPEFGVCRYLGANLFNYFVLDPFDFNRPKDVDEADMMFSTILRESRASRLRKVIEFAIVWVITEYGRKKWRHVAYKFTRSREFYESMLLEGGHENLYVDLKKMQARNKVAA
jgi:hypothetical protein